MNRNLLLLGIIILVAGLFVTYQSSQQFFQNSASSNGVSSGSMHLGKGSTVYMPATFNSSMLIAVAYNSTLPINFYIANESAFSNILPHINSSTTAGNTVQSLEGKGIEVLYMDSARGAFPYQQQYAVSVKPPTYLAENASYFLPADTYYIVFSNLNETANATVFYSMYNRTEASITLSNSTNLLGYGVFGSAMSLIGIALVVISLFLKRKTSEEKIYATDEGINRLYDQVERKPSSKKAAPKKGKKAVK